MIPVDTDIKSFPPPFADSMEIPGTAGRPAQIIRAGAAGATRRILCPAIFSFLLNKAPLPASEICQMAQIAEKNLRICAWNFFPLFNFSASFVFKRAILWT
jgi:hypothetical protein